MPAPSSHSIDESLAKFARETLTRAPTPLDHLPNLSAHLGPDVYLKREDLTDLALGGDKPRKLEYELAEVRQRGSTILVTVGSAQSNHARLTTAAARKFGMECAVVLSRDEYCSFQGNLLTVFLMGARVQFVDAVDHWELERHAHDLCEKLKTEGHRPYFIPVSGTTPTSCLGYVRTGLELADQIAQLGLEVDAIYAPFGTGGIYTATLLALRERGVNCPVIGVSVNRQRQECLAQFEHWKRTVQELLGYEFSRDSAPFEITDEFVGQAYGDPTEACLDAISLLARSEGILLDPVYSGKTCSAFLAQHASGRWQPAQSIVLIHSGGVPALFAYHRQIRDYLVRHEVDIPVM